MSEAVIVAIITGVLSLAGVVGLIVIVRLLMFIIRDLCRWRQDAMDRKEREELKKYE